MSIRRICLAVLLIACASPVRAQSIAPSQVYACVQLPTGLVRIVAATEGCRPGEYRVSWTINSLLLPGGLGPGGTAGTGGTGGTGGGGSTNGTGNGATTPFLTTGFEILVRVDGIDGPEGRDIRALSYSMGASQPGTAGAGGLGGGKPSFQDITIAKMVDVASPKLFIALATGDHIPIVTITVNSISGERIALITLNDVLVSALQTGGDAQGVATIPVENVSFAFTKIEFIAYQKKDGKTTETRVGYDVAANKKL